MKTQELLEILEEIVPFELAEKWDNIGLLVGDKNQEIGKNIYLSLDLTMEIIAKVKKDSTIITHHPLMFKSFNTIDYNSYYGKMLKELIKKNITYISLHTNYDKKILNDYFAQDILQMTNIQQDNFLIKGNFQKLDLEDNKIQTFKKVKDIKSFILENSSLKHTVKNKEIKYVEIDQKKELKNIGVCCGAGSSLLQDAIDNDIDVLITGDITHHVAMEARDMGLGLIDITHFHSEKHFAESLYQELYDFNENQDILSSLEFEFEKFNIEIMDSKNPFSI
jgi:dinuclear metal center YbgI/SA1388 family protein